MQFDHLEFVDTDTDPDLGTVGLVAMLFVTYYRVNMSIVIEYGVYYPE